MLKEGQSSKVTLYLELDYKNPLRGTKKTYSPEA